jgi:hypothetical protein
VYLQLTDTKEYVPSILSVNIVDRTLPSGRSFVPSPSNVISFNEPLWEINDPIDYMAARSNANSFPFWLLWRGRWGMVSRIRPVEQPTCLFDFQTDTGSCPDNGITLVVQALLGFTSLDWVSAIAGELLETVYESMELAAPGPDGLLNRPQFFSWPTPKGTLLVQENKTLSCPSAAFEPGNPAPFEMGNRSQAASYTTLFFALCYTVIGVLFMAGFANWRERSISAKEVVADIKDQDARKDKLYRSCWEFLDNIPRACIAGVALASLGAFVVTQELYFLLALLNAYIPLESIDWDTIYLSVRSCSFSHFAFFRLCGVDLSHATVCCSTFLPFVLLVDLLALVISFLSRGRMFQYLALRVNRPNCCKVVYQTGKCIQAWNVFFLLCANAAGMAIFCLGFLMYGLDFLFRFTCETTVTYSTGVCLDLTQFGVGMVLFDSYP